MLRHDGQIYMDLVDSKGERMIRKALYRVKVEVVKGWRWPLVSEGQGRRWTMMELVAVYVTPAVPRPSLPAP